MAAIGYIIDGPGSPGEGGKEEPVEIRVERVFVPAGSTVGYGFGTTDDGTVEVIFGGDARMMVLMFEALAEGNEVVADLPEWAVLAQREKGSR
jgi:hypothetical protein